MLKKYFIIFVLLKCVEFRSKPERTNSVTV